MFRFKLILFNLVFEYGVFFAVRANRAWKAVAPGLRAMLGLLGQAQREMFRQGRQDLLQGWLLQVPKIDVCPTAVPDDRIHGRFIQRW